MERISKFWVPAIATKTVSNAMKAEINAPLPHEGRVGCKTNRQSITLLQDLGQFNESLFRAQIKLESYLGRHCVVIASFFIF